MKIIKNMKYYRMKNKMNITYISLTISFKYAK